MFDSHCHPTDIEAPAEVLLAAMAVGVHSMLACGYNAESNQAVIELRRQFPSLPISLGIHPWFANEPLEPLSGLIEQARPSVVGECGLDFAPDDSIPGRDTQVGAFEFQLHLASNVRKAVTVHSRRAVAEVFAIIANFPGVVGIMHAFGGSCEQAKGFIDRGWLIGIGGAATRPSAHRVHRLVRELPLQGLALETDAPAIGLEGIYPPHVRPAHLPMVARAVAALRSADLTEVLSVTDGNVARVFGPEVLTAVRVASDATQE